MERHRVSPGTVRLAMARLAADGIIVARPGHGTFVASKAIEVPAEAPDFAWQGLALGASRIAGDAVRSLLLVPAAGLDQPGRRLSVRGSAGRRSRRARDGARHAAVRSVGPHAGRGRRRPARVVRPAGRSFTLRSRGPHHARFPVGHHHHVQRAGGAGCRGARRVAVLCRCDGCRARGRPCDWCRCRPIATAFAPTCWPRRSRRPDRDCSTCSPPTPIPPARRCRPSGGGG